MNTIASEPTAIIRICTKIFYNPITRKYTKSGIFIMTEIEQFCFFRVFWDMAQHFSFAAKNYLQLIISLSKPLGKARSFSRIFV